MKMSIFWIFLSQVGKCEKKQGTKI